MLSVRGPETRLDTHGRQVNKLRTKLCRNMFVTKKPSVSGKEEIDYAFSVVIYYVG
jgi:hypothetical protein